MAFFGPRDVMILEVRNTRVIPGEKVLGTPGANVAMSDVANTTATAVADETRSRIARCPLLFSFRDLVEGKGFLAEVVTHGRGLMICEGPDDFWMYGVNPGGIAAGGKNPDEANVEFRKAYTVVLFDIAYQASDFASFKRSVAAFFDETNLPTEKAWKDAVEEVRAGRIDAEGIPRQPAESPRFVEVNLKVTENLAPQNNAVEPEPALAA